MPPFSDSAATQDAAPAQPRLEERRLARDLARFDRALRDSRSATALLAAWMAERTGRAPLSIIAKRVRTPPLRPGAGLMQRLGVESPGEIAYRRVRLTDGRHVLSDAYNWYVPARLTQGMLMVLDETDTPFGTAVASLSPVRETLHAEQYWPPACTGADRLSRLPARMLRHDALVRGGNGEPLCEVSETYMRTILL